MKFVVIFALTILAVAYARPAEEKYTTKYDNVDLDQILSNKRLLKNYVNCLLEKGSCTPDGAELKRVLPDAIKTQCEKCSEKQRNGSKRVLHHVIDHEPDSWKELEKVYDPTGDYRKKYLAEAEKEGIKL